MRAALFCLLFCAISWTARAEPPPWRGAIDLPAADEPAALSDPALGAQKLNVRAMAYYKEKKYQEAALLFYEATRRDASHVLAHYNLACTLALLRRSLGPCGGIGLADIYRPLAAAIALDPRRRKRARHDPDLAAAEIKNDLAFRLLLGDALGKPARLKQALAGTAYHLGSFNFTSTLTLAPDGQATWVGSRPDPDATEAAIPPPVPFSEQGHWRIEGEFLRIDALGEKSGLYLIHPRGLKKIPSRKAAPDPATVSAFDLPSPAGDECGH